MDVNVHRVEPQYRDFLLGGCLRSLLPLQNTPPPADVRKSRFSSDTEEGEKDILRLVIDRFFLVSEAHWGVGLSFSNFRRSRRSQSRPPISSGSTHAGPFFCDFGTRGVGVGSASNPSSELDSASGSGVWKLAPDYIPSSPSSSSPEPEGTATEAG